MVRSHVLREPTQIVTMADNDIEEGDEGGALLVDGTAFLSEIGRYASFFECSMDNPRHSVKSLLTRKEVTEKSAGALIVI
jgi:hypothetical protein